MRPPSSGIMIMLCLQTQFWFPLMLQMLRDFPLQLPSNRKLLILSSNKQAIHPLLPKMRLLAVPLSGKQSEAEKFQSRLQKLLESWRLTTKSKYEAILKKWKQHALSKNEDPTDTSVESVLSFLHGM